MKNEEKVHIKVKHFFKEKNLIIGYPKEEKETILVKGSFQNIYEGDHLILYGKYEKSFLIGRYFETAFYREVHNEYWLAKWLKVNKHFTNKEIVDLVIDKKGIEVIWDEVESLKKTKKIFQFLLTQHVPIETIAQIEQSYQWEWEAILNDPYQLLRYETISYTHVQTLIKQFGCADPTTSKALYFLENLLKKGYQSGHYYLPKTLLSNALATKGMELAKVPIMDPFIEIEENIYIKKHYEVEKEIAANIHRRLQLESKDVEASIISDWENETKFSLAKNQREAVLMALKENVCVVTGGPGVGKTTTSKCITDILGKTSRILMAAPTGRAAKRASESTGLPATTVHRLLEYNGSGFGKNQTNWLNGDVLVLDESSMIDAPLLLALLNATPITTKLIFLGDVDQLPSVGAGQILTDLIGSGVVPVTKLTEVFRQAAGSPIITLAYAVNSGTLPACTSHEDLCYREYASDEAVKRETLAIAEKLYKEQDVFDVQILIPTYKGPAGIHAINRELQKRLHPDEPFITFGDVEIRQKDKVIQTKNDYNRGIYNGDVGIATFVSKTKIKVKFQGNEQEIDYKPEQFQELQLAYAVTVHRSQGSEYQYVVIPTVKSYQRMLQKNLLYTAITRAKKKLWMIYELEALTQATRLDSVVKRYTTLGTQLKKYAA